MKNLTWQNPEQLFVAQVLINKVKSKCCGIKVKDNRDHGKVFKQMMNDYNRHYGLNITVKIDNKQLPFTDQKPRKSLIQKLIKYLKKIMS